ncbi:MAG: glycoside hydrolase [Planctomycetota bacterium]|nr:glycoside hydrolase [Planctomycetota bacterium]
MPSVSWGAFMNRLAIIVFCVCWTGSVTAGEDTPSSLAEGRQPRLASGENGNVYCVFGAGEDVFCARSADGGATFSAPSKVANHPGLMLGMRRGPRIAVTGDSVVVTAISSSDGNLVAWRSADRGETWSAAARVNDVERVCREGLHDMSADSSGVIGVAWLDLRNRGTQLWSSFSKDGGVTWSENRLVYRSPDGSICECCHPTIASHDGHWSVLWRNSVAGNRDIYVSVSPEGTANFGDATRLGDETWTLAACPMDGGDLAAGSRGAWAVWRRDAVCYATDLDDPSHERRLGRGEQPTVAVTSAGPTFAWIAGRPGDLMLLSPREKQPRKIADRARDPDLISLPDGTVLCAYESIENDKAIVRVSRVPAAK